MTNKKEIIYDKAWHSTFGSCTLSTFMAHRTPYHEHETNKERTNKTRQSDFSTVYICCWSIFAKSQCVYVPFLVQPHNIAIIKQSETMSDIKMAKIINKYKYKEFVVEYQLWMQALYSGGLGGLRDGSMGEMLRILFVVVKFFFCYIETSILDSPWKIFTFVWVFLCSLEIINTKTST